MSDTTPKRRAPAFPLYADDFLAGTADMSAEEVGGYIRLLCHQWTKGGLPNDPDRLARMAGLIGSPSLGYVVAKLTLCEDGLLRHPRIEAIRAESDAWRAKQAASGASGAAKRWGARRRDGDPIGDPIGEPMATPLATPMANGWPNDSSPSPSPSPSPIPTPNALDVSNAQPQGGAGGETVAQPPQDKPAAEAKARKPAPPFVEPKREELDLHAAKIGLPPREVDKFVAYHSARGWMLGSRKMKSWPQAMVTWKLNWEERNGQHGHTGSGSRRPLTAAEQRNATLGDGDLERIQANSDRRARELAEWMAANPDRTPFDGDR